MVIRNELPPSGDGGEVVDVHSWVEESCAVQGIPSKVCDPRVLRDVAVLFTIGRTVATWLNLPDGRDPVRIELVAASDSRPDNDGVQQSGDDGSLASSGKGIPLACTQADRDILMNERRAFDHFEVFLGRYDGRKLVGSNSLGAAGLYPVVRSFLFGRLFGVVSYRPDGVAPSDSFQHRVPTLGSRVSSHGPRSLRKHHGEPRYTQCSQVASPSSGRRPK